MEISYRRLTTPEINTILQTLINARDTNGSAITQLGEPYKVWGSLALMSADNKVAIFYEGQKFIGILVYSFGSPWWSLKTIIEEQLVLCVDKDTHGFLREAIRELEHLADLHHAAAIASGCFFQQHPQMVTNTYTRNGFTETSPTYLKILKGEPHA